ncbi:hypothetical protein P261_02565 [Lachnospiraceae bacterium TWA4]|nr:hypothetical protein P261_02565 [Lachnospiraceae bacterium TWA4]
MIIINLFYKGILWGWILQLNIFTKCTTGKIQILEEIGKKVEWWIKSNDSSANTSDSFYTVFEKIFYKGEDDKESYLAMEQHLSRIGWEKDAQKQIFVIENLKSDDYILSNMNYRYSLKRGVLQELLTDICFYYVI